MDRHRVASSNIGAIGYDTSTQILEVEFLSGRVYQYHDVPEHLHEQIMRASSKGQFLNQHIKSAFPYSRID